MTAFDEAPIFLGGIAGAGKTRLGVLLGRHPRIAVIRRTYLWREFYGRYGDVSDPDRLRRLVDDVLESPGVRALGIDPAVVRREVLAGPPTYGHVFSVVNGLRARDLGKVRWCDQLGLSESFADAILASYPTARMIQMVCDPRSLPEPSGPPGTTGWMIGKWLSSAELAVANAERFADRYLVVRQEDLLTDERSVLERVCDFLGEAFDPAAMLDDGPGPSPATDPARCLLDPYLLRRVEPAMRGFSYDTGVPIGTATLRHRLVDRPANRLGLLAWRVSASRRQRRME